MYDIRLLGNRRSETIQEIPKVEEGEELEEQQPTDKTGVVLRQTFILRFRFLKAPHESIFSYKGQSHNIT